MSASKGPRFQFEIQLPSQESKANFSAVLDEAKRLMTPPGQRKLDNYRLLVSLIDLAKQRLPPLTQALESNLPPHRQLSWQESSGEVVVVYAYLYMYSNQKCVCHVIININYYFTCIYMHAGVYTEDAQPSDQCLFICERKALHDLCIGLTETCSCLGYASWRLESFIQVDSVRTHTCICT